MQSFYDTILKLVSDAIIALDKEGKIILINESGEMILGISSKEVFGNKYSQYLDIDAINPNLEVEKNIIEKILNSSFGKNFLSSDVKVVQKIADPPLKFTGIIYVVRQLNDELLGFIISIHENNAQDYKITAFQQRVHIRAVSQFIFGCAHNLNNIMMSIWNIINLIKIDYNFNSNTHVLLKDMEQELERARTITNQLLELTTKKPLVEKYMDFGGLLKDFISMSLIGTNVKCEFDIDPNIKNVNTEKIQISHILGNIIINAIEAMPNGGTLTIKANNVVVKKNEIPELTVGEYVKVVLTDTGVGIAEEDLDMIFQPNFTTKADKGHQGLGLKITKQLINQNNGHIELTSTYGKGTSVTFYLPVGEWKSKKALTTEK